MKTYSKILPVDQVMSFDLDPHFNHVTVACTYLSDSLAVVEPTTGTLAVEGQVNGNSGFSALDLSPLDATDASSYASTSVPLSKIKITPSLINVATKYQVTVTANSH